VPLLGSMVEKEVLIGGMEVEERVDCDEDNSEPGGTCVERPAAVLPCKLLGAVAVVVSANVTQVLWRQILVVSVMILYLSLPSVAVASSVVVV
jgi:hypothetical protein